MPFLRWTASSLASTGFWEVRPLRGAVTAAELGMRLEAAITIPKGHFAPHRVYHGMLVAVFAGFDGLTLFRLGDWRHFTRQRVILNLNSPRSHTQSAAIAPFQL